MKDTTPLSSFALARRALPLIGLCIALVLLVLLFIYLVDVFLLAFAGVLLAIVLRAPADWLASRTRLTPGWSLALVGLTLALLLTGLAMFFGQSVADQLATLWRRLPELLSSLRDRLAGYEWLTGPLDLEELLGGSKATVVGRGIDAVVATFGAAANLVIVLVTALFFAVQPKLYVNGFLQLVPRAQRPRAGEVIAEVGHTLRWWLLGQLFLMVAVALITGIGLWALGVPLALALAVLAGLLEFVPYVGPLIAAIPAILVALSESTTLAGYVVLLYLAVQGIEGNLLQPVIQHRTVYLPPAMILIAQLVLGILVGTIGVMLATPLAATTLVLTRMLYVEDVLGQRKS